MKCIHCGVPCSQIDALVVQWPSKQIFCEEACIKAFFKQESESLLKRFEKSFSSAPSHDLVYYELRSFENKKVLIECFGDTYQVSIFLSLFDQPSFLFLSFFTKDNDLIRQFKRGALLIYHFELNEEPKESLYAFNFEEQQRMWLTTIEVHPKLELKLTSDRKGKCFESTLESPSELWMQQNVAHYIKKFEFKAEPFWVVVLGTMETRTSLQVLDVFFTRNQVFIQQCRMGINVIDQKKTIAYH